MRQVVYGAACSLDGFIAAHDGSLDWLHYSKDVERVMARQWPRYDTVLMGRRTWVAGQKMGGGPVMPGVTTYVFSSTLAASETPGATLVREDAAEFVRRLKATPGNDICLMGGGLLTQSLLAAGLVDEVGANIHPVLLGRGDPLFRDPGHRVALRLLETERLDGGCVLATYQVIDGADRG
jgi:dihydrofolate reductase